VYARHRCRFCAHGRKVGKALVNHEAVGAEGAFALLFPDLKALVVDFAVLLQVVALAGVVGVTLHPMRRHDAATHAQSTIAAVLTPHPLMI
jgi:hypothetical protein